MAFRILIPPALLAALLLPGCAATLSHQAELLLHPHPVVQGGALIGAAPGTLIGAPIWGTLALFRGPGDRWAGMALHVFAWPGAVLVGGIPWIVAGPSFEIPSASR